MKALEFLKQHRVYEDETIYNSVGEMVGTLSQLMEDYAALRQPHVMRSFTIDDILLFGRWMNDSDTYPTIENVKQWLNDR